MKKVVLLSLTVLLFFVFVGCSGGGGSVLPEPVLLEEKEEIIGKEGGEIQSDEFEDVATVKFDDFNFFDDTKIQIKVYDTKLNPEFSELKQCRETFAWMFSD